MLLGTELSSSQMGNTNPNTNPCHNPLGLKHVQVLNARHKIPGKSFKLLWSQLQNLQRCKNNNDFKHKAKLPKVSQAIRLNKHRLHSTESSVLRESINERGNNMSRD